MAATPLGLEPAEIIMVASHKHDLDARRFQTAVVAHLLEYGGDPSPDDTFTVNAAI